MSRQATFAAFTTARTTARRPVTPDDYRARSVLFIPEKARLSRLVHLPETQDLGA